MSKVKFEVIVSGIENAETASNLQVQIIELIDKEMKLNRYPVNISFYHDFCNIEKER